MPLLDRKSPLAAKAYALEKGRARLDYLDAALTGREYLLDRFSVADAYLVTVLSWTRAVNIDLGEWPAVKDYLSRLRKRPSIAKALAEEAALYAEEQARHKAA